MKRTFILAWIGVVLPVLALPAPGASRVDFTLADNVLTVTTDRYEVVWQNGSMVGLKTFLPKPTEVTVAGRPMNVEQLPNGLASLHGVDREVVKRLHHPWGSFKLDERFPAQHPPTAESKVEYKTIPNGARLTYRGLKDDPEALLTQELEVDKVTGDLVIRQYGRSSNPGVFGLGFSLLNLRPDLVFDTAYFGGQRWDPDYAKNVTVSLATGSVFWGADLIVGEIPSGGCFVVRAEDPRMEPKMFRRYNDGSTMALNFQANGIPPYEGNKEVSICTWKFNTYGGSWMDAAKPFKDWMVKTFNLVPRSQRSSKWVDDIALVCPTYVTEPLLKEMSEIVDLKKALFMNWGWLKDFNRRVPEYLPADPEAAKKSAALAHRYGARVGMYTSLALVDVKAHPTIMKDYDLDFYYRAPADDKPTEAKGWLIHVHPGSQKWRELYAGKMDMLHREFGLDYLYQDVTGCAIGSSGLVEGRTFNEGVIACEAAIRQKSPQVALGGEYWTQLNAVQEDFGITGYLAWGGEDHKEFITRPHQPHPLLSYLFADYCIHWPHQTTIREKTRFHRSQNIEEVVGAIPVWSTTPDDRTSEARVVLERSRLWADGFRPYFPKKWEKGVVSYMRNPAGRVVKYDRPEASTFCYESKAKGDELRYARVTETSSLSLPTPVSIDGWLGYGDKGPIGLNPKSWYSVFPGAPKNLPVRITGLSDGVFIRGIRQNEKYCLVELEGTDKGTVCWELQQADMSLLSGATRAPARKGKTEVSLPGALVFAAVDPAEATINEPFALGEWDCVVVSEGHVLRAGTIDRHARFVFEGGSFDGYQVFPPAGGKGSEISLDNLVKLPADPKLGLNFKMGRFGGSGEGVHFVVRVNGMEIWRQFSESKRGWTDATVPLADHAGQALVLSLAVDCGNVGYHLSNDQAIWGEVKVVKHE